MRCAAKSDWQQAVVVGTPSHDPEPEVGELRRDQVLPLLFDSDALPYSVPGMSDVMPYQSTRFGAMDTTQLSAYRRAWHRHLAAVIADFRPDVIHSHHVWLVSSLLKDIAPPTPVVNQCHATGLRQIELVTSLAREVRRGCARNEAFAVLHRDQAGELGRVLGIQATRIHVTGAGYRDDIFHRTGRADDSTPSLLYVGKFSGAKGLPFLLDAFEAVSKDRPWLRLHVAGDGTGPEAEALRARMTGLHPRVILHGQLAQLELSELMRRSTACVLPSLFEGMPLVLVEAHCSS